MTTTTLHSASIVPARRVLENLASYFAKGAEHFAGQGVPDAEWLASALAPDMFPLSRQIQTASDSAKNLAARLSGAKAPTMPDIETSAAELQERLARTIAYLDSVPASAIDGREDEEIIVTLPMASLRFTGASYGYEFGLPNLYFHAATAYAILRHKGVPLGKIDFLGQLDMRPTG